MSNTHTKSRTTGIEWTDHTWNPFIGCSKKSSGCKNCYAIRQAYRLEQFGNEFYSDVVRKNSQGVLDWSGKINLNSGNAIEKPLNKKTPSIFFVNSMSDFFHPGAKPVWREIVLEVISATPHHTYQILTKRPENVLKMLNEIGVKRVPDNLWLGATIEGNSTADRIHLVRRFPAKVKFLSVEPLIEPLKRPNFKGIDWVITGGESGPGARKMSYEWLLEAHESCIKYNTPHFFKQYGKASNNPLFWKKWKGQLVPRENASTYVKEKDPIGKGGSMIDGEYIKELPKGFNVADYK